jgi:hypothetical protein
MIIFTNRKHLFDFEVVTFYDILRNLFCVERVVSCSLSVKSDWRILIVQCERNCETLYTLLEVLITFKKFSSVIIVYV